ncbi:hypothetical protein Tsubulata_022545 [Turnera subulata]|uniref:ALBINO3-like protein 2, chloroplastic n=1 Tax=Turnera subulata TaxID=218843 RepID=A0A9Q0J1Q5_9ROSI|nr:hypothetical protein Tsubulata_022545 [Turnera subulata]
MAIPWLIRSQMRRRSLYSLSRLLHEPINPTIPTATPGDGHFLASSSFIHTTSPFSAAHFSSSSSHSSLDPPQDFPPSAALDALAAPQDDSILPYNAIISLLDSFHDCTGFPWWVIIASSTVAMRLTIFPLLVLQLQKLKQISHYFPRLPFPFPPPLSGRSYIHQYSLFRRQRRAIGCPSYLWFLASVSVQVPCFLLWMSSIRRMCVNNHLGFDSGGALWFQNLCESPQGSFGFIFPLLIAGLHYTNVQLAFDKSSTRQMTGLLGLLAKYYRSYLNVLSVPLFFIGYCIPQGSLVYWVTNSSLSVIQHVILKNPVSRAKLGLQDGNSPEAAANSEEIGVRPLVSPLNSGNVVVENLSPQELFGLSAKRLTSGQVDAAIHLLQVLIKKDPDHINALILMGQALLQKGLDAEAIECFEGAVSKVFLAGYQNHQHQLILASQLAGLAYTRKGKFAEGIIHLERVASLNEPDDPNVKREYFATLVLLASALYNQDRRAEAARYLRLAVAFDPNYKELLEQCEKDDESFVGDLVNSRRGD